MERAHIIVQLVHIQGPFRGKIQEFTQDRILIGRHPSCDLQFPPDLAVVSRRHAEIVREGNRFKLIDQSANGTFVNGKRVKEGYLRDGDVLTIAQGGPKVSFLTQVSDTPLGEKAQEETSPPQMHQVPEPTPTPQAPSPPSPPHPTPVRDTSQVSYKEAKVNLVIQFGPTLRSFDKVPVTMGKGPACQFQIDHPSLLDRHAEIFYVEGQYWIKDLTGRHLVSINGNPIDLGATLNPDDILSLTPEGPAFKFLGGGRLLEVEIDAQSPQPSPPNSGEPLEEAPPKEKEKNAPMGKARSFFSKYLKR